jgi:hypothetical protein
MVFCSGAKPALSNKSLVAWNLTWSERALSAK